jgi:uncharacterized protein involved in exopolysaccharide biosynthesis
MSDSSAARVVWPRPQPERPPSPDTFWPAVEILLRHRRLLVVATVAAALLGLGLAFVLPKSYTSTASFVPEERGAVKNLGALGGLVGQLDILGGGGSESPDFYQRLLTSRHLRTEILTTAYGGHDLVEYYHASGRRDSLEKAAKKFSKDYAVSVDRVTRIVTLDVELKSPQLAQAVARRMLQAVDSFNSTIRRTMAGERRRFIEQRFQDAAAQLDAAEREVRDFNMRNRSIADAPALQFERGRLERRVQLATTLYQSLSQQLQTARIDEINDTPVISTIDPPSLPVRPSSPRRVVMTLLSALLGFLLAFAVVLWRDRRAHVGAP